MKCLGGCRYGIPSVSGKDVPMEETNKKATVQEEPVPYIKREVDGAVYTVMIHFNPESRETAKEKVERLLLKDALNGNFPD